METFVLVKLADGWTRFEPQIFGNDRSVSLREKTWKSLGKPLTLQVTIENLEALPNESKGNDNEFTSTNGQ